jgi:geranylgeranyl diphosphate synthase type I
MEFLERRQELVNERLREVLSAMEPSALREQVEHVSLSGGKRVRPVVTVLACEAAGGTAEDAVDYGVGIELVHNASLVVDDIIDKSDLRRGTASAWTEYGYGPAIVASDGLLGEAFALFSQDPQATQVVAEAMVELGEGEATELAAMPTNEDEYMELARRKTGALFRAAAELGAIAADTDPYTVEKLGEYAERVGVAFQIRDDVLDETADADALGKPTGIDEAMERPSVVQVTELSAGEATDRAEAESEAALSALSAVDADDTQAGQYLRDLARFVVVRER